ncbi:unnamed protein product, partial [Larinioides sclopetarius]
PFEHLATERKSGEKNSVSITVTTSDSARNRNCFHFE